MKEPKCPHADRGVCGECRLGQVLVMRAFGELVRAREQRRLDRQRWGLPPEPDPSWWHELTGNRDS